MWNDEFVFEEICEGSLEGLVCHERYLDWQIGGWRLVVLVLTGNFELVECHGFVGFFNVLPQPPEKEKVFDVVLHASEGSESQEGLLGLRCKVEEGEER